MKRVWSLRHFFSSVLQKGSFSRAHRSWSSSQLSLSSAILWRPLESLAAALPLQVGTSQLFSCLCWRGGDSGKGTLLYSLAKNKYAKKPGPESKSDDQIIQVSWRPLFACSKGEFSSEFLQIACFFQLCHDTTACEACGRQSISWDRLSCFGAEKNSERSRWEWCRACLVLGDDSLDVLKVNSRTKEFFVSLVLQLIWDI